MKITLNELKTLIIKEIRKDYDEIPTWERNLIAKERPRDWEEEEDMPKTPEEQAALDAEIARSEEEYKERKGLDRTIRRGYRHETAFELKDLLEESGGVGRYMLVKELPHAIQAALIEVGYGRKDIMVEPSVAYTAGGPGGSSMRSFTAVCDLGSEDRYKIIWGSWGGANMFNKSNQVDLDTASHEIPYNGAVVKGSMGGGRPVYAHVLVNPENLQKMLPAGNDVNEELTEQEKKALKIIKTYRAGARKDGFARHDLGPYTKDNPILQKFVKNGWIVISGAGLQITLAGKNKAEDIQGVYV